VRYSAVPGREAVRARGRFAELTGNCAANHADGPFSVSGGFCGRRVALGGISGIRAAAAGKHRACVCGWRAAGEQPAACRATPAGRRARIPLYGSKGSVAMGIRAGARAARVHSAARGGGVGRNGGCEPLAHEQRGRKTQSVRLRPPHRGRRRPSHGDGCTDGHRVSTGRRGDGRSE